MVPGPVPVYTRCKNPAGFPYPWQSLLVDLGVLRNVIEDHVLQLGVIEEQPAGQEGYKIPDGKNWSCAWWVIRALRELVKEGVPIPKLPANNLELYNRVVVPLAAEMNSALAPLHM